MRAAALLSALVVASPALPQETPPGGALYQKMCAQCHGENGDGQGVAATRLLPRPRDFTAGKFKIRHTPSGALPTDGDLADVIREGMPYSSMPAWNHLSEAQIQELVTAVKSFSADFVDAQKAPTPITVPSAPKMTPESIAKGKEVYERIGCGSCHGELGRGDGSSAPLLKDDWGHPVPPADLTMRWTYRGGPTREDIYRTFTTGLNGTPMPSFAESLSDEERWQLVDYVASLGRGEEPGYSDLLQVQWSDEELDLSRGAELFAAAPPSHFSLVGQITEPGRSFHPLVSSLTARAVYNTREIAFLLTWHDMRADQSGRNGPDLAVPPTEDEVAEAAAPAADDGGGFWGDEETEPAAEGGDDDFWGEDEGAATAATSSGAEFSDAVAIQLPVTLPTGIRKPYFIFGDAQDPVDVWFLELAAPLGIKPARRYSAAGSSAITPVEGEDVVAQASYDRGEWSVILKRALRSSGGVTFAESQFVPIAFSVWDGASRERGNKRALTQWMYLYTMPRETPSPLWPMLRSALLVLGVEVGLVAWVRKRRRTPQA